MENSKFVSDFVVALTEAVKGADGLLSRLGAQLKATPEGDRKALQKALYAAAKAAGDRQYAACRKLWSLAAQGKTSGVTKTKAEETPLVKFLRESASKLNRRNGVQDFSPVVYAMLTDCMNEYKAEAEAEAE